MQAIFWFSFLIIFYAYIGYGILLFIIIKCKRMLGNAPKTYSKSYRPKVTLLVAAYNEEDFIAEKVENSLKMKYDGPLEFIFVTDGSTDRTPEIVARYPKVKLMHSDGRKGKLAAVNRAIAEIDSEIVIFTDANTYVNDEAVANIVRHFEDEKVGGVAGEKRIYVEEEAEASSAGEGIYWKYESALKKWDSELYSVVGAAGELFAIRKELHEHIPPDTIIEDFYQTLRINQKGYKVIYEPEAYAGETSSASVGEELKRKIRIAAGGIQAIVRLSPLLNPFKHGVLTFQYVSHRVLRWTIAPIALLLLFLANIFLAISGSPFYIFTMTCQILFYGLAGLGYIFEKRQVKVKALFVPYYFFIMNYAVYRGFGRYLKGSQSVLWERAERKK